MRIIFLVIFLPYDKRVEFIILRNGDWDPCTRNWIPRSFMYLYKKKLAVINFTKHCCFLRKLHKLSKIKNNLMSSTDLFSWKTNSCWTFWQNLNFLNSHANIVKSTKIYNVYFCIWFVLKKTINTYFRLGILFLYL